jgi:hypothetical protein
VSGDVFQSEYLGGIPPSGRDVAGSEASFALGGSRGDTLHFLERVPLSASGTFAYPLGRLLSAVVADIHDLILCHNSYKGTK